MADTLASALVQFQAQVPTIAKNRTAKIPMKGGGSYSYKYADLSDVWDAIRRPLAESGLAVTQALTTVTAGCMGIKTKLWHISGDTDESVVEFPVAGKSAQEIGSQITYMRRYALTSALGLDTDDDDDGNAATRPRPADEPTVTPADKARADLLAVIKGGGLDARKIGQRFADDYGVNITAADAKTIAAFVGVIKDEIAIDKAADA